MLSNKIFLTIKAWIYGLCFALFLFAQPLFAQTSSISENSTREALTFQQCIELAIQNNNNLKSAIASQKASGYRKNAAVSGFLPQATANVASSRGAIANATQAGVVQNYSNSVSITQNVFAGFQDVGKFDQAKAENMVAMANIEIVKAQVIPSCNL